MLSDVLCATSKGLMMTMKMMMMMMRLVMANLFLKYSVVTALESYVKGHGTPGKLGMSGQKQERR